MVTIDAARYPELARLLWSAEYGAKADLMLDLLEAGRRRLLEHRPPKQRRDQKVSHDTSVAPPIAPSAAEAADTVPPPSPPAPVAPTGFLDDQTTSQTLGLLRRFTD
jgi:hypothetical protein